jgi:hypothetical protein
MYFAGKVQQSLAICDFIDHGYRVPGVFYLYQVLPDKVFSFTYPSFLNICAYARKGGVFHTKGATSAGDRKVRFN